MTFREVAPPTAEPLSLTAVKLHCKITQSEEDAWLARAITTAREMAEAITGLAFMARQCEIILDAFPDGFELHQPPVRSITSVKYTDINGAEQTLSAASYTLDKYSKPAWLVPAYDYAWPDTRVDINAARVRYVAGSLMPCVADASADTLTAAGHGYVTDDPVPFGTQGAAPGGLTDGTIYYASAVTTNTLKLAATPGGAAIDITSLGTGIHLLGSVPAAALQAMLLMIGHNYEHRESVSDFQTFSVPQNADWLLSPLTILRM